MSMISAFYIPHYDKEPANKLLSGAVDSYQFLEHVISAVSLLKRWLTHHSYS